ncbi:MAG: flavoprotein [Eubacteriales bacterium]|nr:flavoprotein [Eubacteriales bacterium]
MSKAANGIADNLLTAGILSAECPVAFVLNCNPYMYGKPAAQRNLEGGRDVSHGKQGKAGEISRYG